MAEFKLYGRVKTILEKNGLEPKPPPHSTLVLGCLVPSRYDRGALNVHILVPEN